MPRVSLFGRRLGPVGVAITVYDIYRRLPPKQRKRVLDLTRRHGTKVALAAYARTQAKRAAKKKP